MTCPVLSHLPVCSHVCTRPGPHCVARMCPAFCGPHSRPHASPRWRSRLRLRLRLSGLLARAWARAVSVPTSHTRPSARVPSPVRPTACSPSRLSLLSGAARPVSLAQTMIVAVVRTAVRTALPNSRPSRVFASDGGAIGRSPLHARACQVWGLGCRHRRRQPVRDRSPRGVQPVLKHVVRPHAVVAQRARLLLRWGGGASRTGRASRARLEQEHATHRAAPSERITKGPHTPGPAHPGLLPTLHWARAYIPRIKLFSYVVCSAPPAARCRHRPRRFQSARPGVACRDTHPQGQCRVGFFIYSLV